MITLYHISKPDDVSSHKKQSSFLEKSCKDRDIKYLRFIEGDRGPLDYNNLQPKDTDLVYRSACGKWAKKLERHLLLRGGKNIFFSLEPGESRMGTSYHAMLKQELPVIPSIEFVPWKKADVFAVSEHLGGFPLIIKVSGGMEGAGIIRVDSIEAMNSTLDYLRRDTKAELRLMKYVNHDYYARVVVVGDRVVAAVSDVAPIGDFRTSARGPRKRPSEIISIPKPVADMSIKATKALGVKTGGVDVLFSKDGSIYITEVNRPFNFAETQDVTGVDIAGEILDELLVS